MPKKRPASPLPPRSDCPTSSFLDLVGDRWTLLVMRDLLLKGYRRYGELASSREKIPTNLLADRLTKLEDGGLITRQLYQQRPPRYEYRPTSAGVDLLDVIAAMVQWSNTHLPATKVVPPARYAAAKRQWKKALKAPAP
jgi:DNA-binding HxlR family transcriptional regulator